jgi:hypothetical protein
MGATMGLATLVVALGAPSTVFARGRWQDVLSPRGGGRSSAVYGAPEPKVAPERVRSPAPSVSDVAPVPVRSVREIEHQAGDRLREALAAAQDDPRGAARISHLIAQAAAEARRNKALGERVWYWRDPFSANPRQPIVLSLEVQLEMQLWAARQEAARAHIASSTARAEAAAAHAEAARARLDAARAQRAAEKGRTPISRPESRATRSADDSALAAALAGGPSPTTTRRPSATAARGDDDDATAEEIAAARKRPTRRPSTTRTALARNERAAGPGSTRHRDIGAARTPAAPTTGADEPATAPPAPPASAAWHSKDPRGIVVVPIGTSASPIGSASPVATLPRRR